MASPHRALEPTTGSALEVQASLPEELRHSVRRASEVVRSLNNRVQEPPLTTALQELDELLGGGLPRGALVELVGRGSCGRFATLLTVLKTVTDAGEVAALVDQGEQLDPRAAAAIGIDLDRLLWLRPRSLPDTLAAAEVLVHTRFPLVALDLGLPPVRGRAPLAAWLRLARSTTTNRSVVLVGSPYRLSGCAAAAVVTSSWDRGWWSGAVGTPRLLHGLKARLELARHRGQRPHANARTAFTMPEAVFGPAPDPPSQPTATREIDHAQAL